MDGPLDVFKKGPVNQFLHRLLEGITEQEVNIHRVTNHDELGFEDFRTVFCVFLGFARLVRSRIKEEVDNVIDTDYTSNVTQQNE